jgi:putative Mg2+ transporter-C (MgtC) family protein
MMSDLPPGFYSDVILRLLVSLIIGAAIGLEREYWTKAAGFRTMIMICLGSTLFTIVSIKLGGDEKGHHIASNIVTGIGFLGGGVIFKDGLTVTGITTATTIWITAALGMVVGSGDFITAGVGGVFVLVVLSILQKIQQWVEHMHQSRNYKISMTLADDKAIEAKVKQINLKINTVKVFKKEDEITYTYDLHGSLKNMKLFNEYLLQQKEVISFEY